MADALRALWVGQGIATALAGPRALGAAPSARALGLGVLIAVALPVVAAAWLAHAASGRALVRGVGASVVWGAAVIALAGALDAAPLTAQPRRIALAALEIALAAAVWALRRSWLAWIAA